MWEHSGKRETWRRENSINEFIVTDNKAEDTKATLKLAFRM